MKTLILLSAGLLTVLRSYGQLATTTQYGLVKVGTGLSVTNGVLNATGGATSIAFAQVSTYQDLLNLGTPTVLTVVKVATDADKGIANQEYNLWPDGTRTYNGVNDKLVVYTATGTIINDNGGAWANDNSQSYDKAFDGNVTTYYRASNATPWVGRDLGAAKSLNRVILTPVQDSGNATNLNGAQVQYSTDGSSWTTIGSAVTGITSTNYTTPVTVNFTATSARYWRVQLVNFGWLAEMQLLYSRN